MLVRKWLTYTIPLLLAMLPGLYSTGQYNPGDFIHYTTNEGLSNNYIASFQQDPNGYIWIATDAGLNRFDGNSFTQYNTTTNNLRLLSGKISLLKMFTTGELAIVSRNGLQILNTKTYDLKNFTIPDSSAFSVYLNCARDVCEAPNNSKVISTLTGLYVFDKNGRVSFRHDAYKAEDVGKKSMRYGRDIMRVNDNYLLNTDSAGLAVYNYKTRSFQKIQQGDPEWSFFLTPPEDNPGEWIADFQLSDREFIFINLLKDNIVYYNYASGKKVVSPLPFNCFKELNYQSRITLLNESDFLINSATGGFYQMHINRQTGEIKSSKEKNLSSLKINCLFTDKGGRLWIGTPAGVLQQKLTHPLISSYSFIPSEIGDDITGAFSGIIYLENKIYASRYSRNAGLVILNEHTMKPESVISFYGKNNFWNEVTSIQMYHPDTLWLGTNAGILWFDTKTKNYGPVDNGVRLPPGTANYIELKPANNDHYAWFCYLLKGIAGRYHIPTRSFETFTLSSTPALPFRRVKNVITTTDGNAWLVGHGMTRWNNKQHTFDTLITEYGGPKKFNDNIVAASAGQQGDLWMHNEENGLLHFDPQLNKFMFYGGGDGFPTEVFESMSPVVDGILWLANGTQLVRFDTHTKKTVVFNQHDGLPLQKVSSNEISYNPERHQYSILFQNEIALFKEPAGMIQNSAPILIQAVTVNNKSFALNRDSTLRLSPSENNPAIHFTSIDFESGANYSFAYKINNAKSWTNIGSQRTINLTGLPSGTYEIHLKTYGKPDTDKEARLTIIIEPPFWKRTGFIAFSVALLLALLIYLYQRRIRQIRQKANLDKQLAETEMKSLHSQMNPHFIFNSLNSIREMILNNETKEASHYLSKFAHLVRITLDQSVRPFVSLRNTIDYIQRYIEMEKIRNPHFTSSISCDKNLDVDDSMLPPMLIQPFIENAIWHGVSATTKTIHVNINFLKKGDMLICTIEDNGIGIRQSLQNKQSSEVIHQSVGIENVKTRIALLNEKYNLESSLKIEDKEEKQSGTGTLVTISLPLETQES